MLILAVGAPKGGVGKSTTAATLATLAARVLKLRTLLVDADDNRTVLDWIGDSDALDVAGLDPTPEGRLDVDQLRGLRRADAYDLAVVDLPGARLGAFEAVLAGDDGRPVADLLLVPTQPEAHPLRPTVRAIRQEVIPLGLPHLVVLTSVETEKLRRADERRQELRDHQGLTVAETIVRHYTAYDEAVERGVTVVELPRGNRYVRRATADARALADEVFTRLGIDTAPLRRDDDEELT